MFSCNDIWGSNSGCGSCCSKDDLPMEFIQVLIHQHAKTLVALQSLQSEVSTLKHQKKHHHTPTTSTPFSKLFSPPAHPLHTHTHSQSPILSPSTSTYYNQPQNTSSVTNSVKKPDSGFTERLQNSTEEDELYSLLSLIQFKVESLKPNKRSKEELGKLDKLLGNADFDFNKFKIRKEIIKGVLECTDLGELKRQVLFLAAKVESMERDRDNDNCDKKSRIPVGVVQQKQQLGVTRSEVKSPTIKSLNSISSHKSQKSLIPVPINRIKINSRNKNKLWQWFG